MWWKLCKESDESNQVGFDDQFDNLITFISNNAKTNEATLSKHGLPATHGIAELMGFSSLVNPYHKQ
jgi:hypothetical protein